MSKERVFALIERVNQLGRMLPPERDIEALDLEELQDVKLILAEMNKANAALDEILGIERTDDGRPA